MDTTSTTMTFALYNTYANQNALKRVQEEIDATSSAEERLTLRQCESMPFLSAIIQETLRLYSASPAIFPRVVPHQGVVVGSHAIPGGASIATQPYSVHRDPEIFGYDCDIWRPERWMTNDTERTKRMHAAMMPFSKGRCLDRFSRANSLTLSLASGSRNCLGQNLAYLEIYLILATIFKTFDGAPDPKCTPITMKPKVMVLLGPSDGRCVSVCHRAIPYLR